MNKWQEKNLSCVEEPCLRPRYLYNIWGNTSGLCFIMVTAEILIYEVYSSISLPSVVSGILHSVLIGSVIQHPNAAPSESAPFSQTLSKRKKKSLFLSSYLKKVLSFLVTSAVLLILPQNYNLAKSKTLNSALWNSKPCWPSSGRWEKNAFIFQICLQSNKNKTSEFLNK